MDFLGYARGSYAVTTAHSAVAHVVDGAATVCFNLVVTDFCVDGAVVTALVLNGEDTPVAVAPTASGPVRLRWRQHNILDVIHPECGQQGLRWPS